MRWLSTRRMARGYGIIEGDEVAEVKGDPFARLREDRDSRKLNAVSFSCRVSRKLLRGGSITPSTSPRWRRNARGAQHPPNPMSATVQQRARPA